MDMDDRGGVMSEQAKHLVTMSNSTGNDFAQNMWTVTVDSKRKRFTDEEVCAGVALAWVNEQTGVDMFNEPVYIEGGPHE
jgi:hypothetical protein